MEIVVRTFFQFDQIFHCLSNLGTTLLGSKKITNASLSNDQKVSPSLDYVRSP